MKHSRRYNENAEKVKATERVSVAQAVRILKDCRSCKFDETVEVSLNLGIDPRQADQAVRGSVVLPQGLGKTVTIDLGGNRFITRVRILPGGKTGAEEAACRTLSYASRNPSVPTPACCKTADSCLPVSPHDDGNGRSTLPRACRSNSNPNRLNLLVTRR